MCIWYHITGLTAPAPLNIEPQTLSRVAFGLLAVPFHVGCGDHLATNDAGLRATPATLLRRDEAEARLLGL